MSRKAPTFIFKWLYPQLTQIDNECCEFGTVEDFMSGKHTHSYKLYDIFSLSNSIILYSAVTVFCYILIWLFRCLKYKTDVEYIFFYFLLDPTIFDAIKRPYFRTISKRTCKLQITENTVKLISILQIFITKILTSISFINDLNFTNRSNAARKRYRYNQNILW